MPSPTQYLFTAAFTIALGASAGEKTLKRAQVPEVVLKAAEAKYPQAKFTAFLEEIEDGKTIFEVQLEQAGHKTELMFAPDGTWVTEEQVLVLKEVPEAVQKALLNSAYGKAKVKRIEKVIDAKTPDAPHFEFLVAAAGKRHELVFNLAGDLERESLEKKE
jgi:Putative beta-lactamase-inhibitor-like, PepSY-like